MQSQSSNERDSQPSLRHIALYRQLFRVNKQRATTWFSKHSCSRFKRKSDTPRSPSPSHSSAGDILACYESLTMHSEPTRTRSVRPTPPQTTRDGHSRWPTFFDLTTMHIIPGYPFPH